MTDSKSKFKEKTRNSYIYCTLLLNIWHVQVWQALRFQFKAPLRMCGSVVHEKHLISLPNANKLHAHIYTLYTFFFCDCQISTLHILQKGKKLNISPIQPSINTNFSTTFLIREPESVVTNWGPGDGNSPDRRRKTKSRCFPKTRRWLCWYFGLGGEVWKEPVSPTRPETEGSYTPSGRWNWGCAPGEADLRSSWSSSV